MLGSSFSCFELPRIPKEFFMDPHRDYTVKTEICSSIPTGGFRASTFKKVNDGSIEASFELAGVDPNAVSLSAERDCLILEFTNAAGVKQKHSWSIVNDYDVNAATASLKLGVLFIKVPPKKPEQRQNKKIDISI